MSVCVESSLDGERSDETDCDKSAKNRNVYVCGQKMVVKYSAMPIGSIKKRCQLSLRRARITDLAAVLAIGGVALAVIDAELLAARVIKEGHFVSLTLRWIIIISAFILLATIVSYHVTEVKILLLDSSNRDWCVVITLPRLLQCAVEMIVCCICPLPVRLDAPNYVRMKEDRRTEYVSISLSSLLTMAMFLRFYLLCRFTALRSRYFRDAATRTVASLNRIPINFPFVLKTLMYEHPLTVLLILWTLFAVSASWLFAQCERQGSHKDHPGYLHSIWFTMATLMANGYGDTVPKTYCGRALAAITSIAGAGITAALVAVTKRKLQLTRAEKRVNEFVKDTKFTVQKKKVAATILQNAWHVHKAMTQAPYDYHTLRAHKRHLMNSISDFRRVRFHQRMLYKNSYSQCEVTYIQRAMKQLMRDFQKRHAHAIQLSFLISHQLDQLQWHLANCSENVTNDFPSKPIPLRD